MANETPIYPVALERDVEQGSLVRARLEGMGLLLWRADDDIIRVWEDRCPHRSIRLSAGRNLGEYVEGAYHGWRFGKDGTVMAIPAEGYKARADIRVRALSSTIHAGLVWATLGDKVQVPADYKPDKSAVLVRPVPFATTAAAVSEALRSINWANLIVTPTSHTSCFVFGHVKPERGGASTDTLRRCNDRLTILRRSLEAGLAP